MFTKRKFVEIVTGVCLFWKCPCCDCGGEPQRLPFLTFCFLSVFPTNSCYNLVKPMNWTYCTTYTAVPGEETTCEMEVNGTKCNSCTLLGSNCRVFDCENTMIGKSSSTCGYSMMEAYTSSYLYEQLPCDDGCSLCPDGEVMGSPDDSFVTSTGSISNCFVAQLSALTGDLTSSECAAESRRVGNCDCGETPEPTQAPTSSSSTTGLLFVLATTSAMAFLGLTGGM